MNSPFSDKANKYDQKIKEWRKIFSLHLRSYLQSSASLGQRSMEVLIQRPGIFILECTRCGGGSVCIPEHAQFKIYITEYSQH